MHSGLKIPDHSAGVYLLQFIFKSSLELACEVDNVVTFAQSPFESGLRTAVLKSTSFNRAGTQLSTQPTGQLISLAWELRTNIVTQCGLDECMFTAGDNAAALPLALPGCGRFHGCLALFG